MTRLNDMGRAPRPGMPAGAEAPAYIWKRARAKAPACIRTGILLLAVLPLSALSLAAQQVRDTRAIPSMTAPTGTGAIGGVVTNDDGSRPVRFAYMVLIGTGTGTVKVSSTDGDGRFLFTNLPADRYTVGASKPPYLGTVAGARRPARPGTPIVVADGQKIANLAIRMPLGAAISGSVTDEKGQPGAGIMVALQQWRMQSGQRVLVTVQGSGSSDERGRYRFYGLAPGEYVIVATRGGLPLAPRALTATEVDTALKGGPVPQVPAVPRAMPRYAPVYYPGTTRMADAQPVTVAAGDERQNVDFRFELVQTARVEGTVVASDGQAVTAGSVILTTAGANVLRTATSTRITPDGRFAFPDAMPGAFMVLSQGSGPTAGQYAQAIIEVDGADVLGVQLTMRPLLSFSGTLAFRGAMTAPVLAGRRIPLRALAPNASGSGPAITPTTATGAFTVTNVFPGRYVIGGPLAFGPTNDSVTWALESVVVDGRDVTDLPIDINADTLPKDVVITFSDRCQELSGRLTRSTGAPVPEHTIIVFPADKSYWVSGSRRIVVTRPGTDGRFALSGAGPTTLPPGNYLLAAVTDIDRDEQFDPAFLSALIPASVPITLQPGEKKVQDLVIR
jgi:hypothetical protein